MKKALILAVALSIIIGGVAVAGVLSSKHDMRFISSGEEQNNATAVCEFCHHPHRGASASAFTNALIWNKVTNTPATYAAYVNTATMAGAASAVDLSADLNTNGLYATALCMSCHDSVNASNGIVRAVRGMANTTLTLVYDNPASDLGDTLEDDHPVNFEYVQDVGDDIPEPDGAGMFVGTYPLYDGWFQCATCHDVHMGNNSASTAVQFMRGDTLDSAICIDCHTNK